MIVEVYEEKVEVERQLSLDALAVAVVGHQSHLLFQAADRAGEGGRELPVVKEERVVLGRQAQHCQQVVKVALDETHYFVSQVLVRETSQLFYYVLVETRQVTH